MKTSKLETFPNPVVFSNLKIGERKSVQVSVRNVSKRSLSIRFSLPQNSLFTIQLNNKSNRIPPGLTVQAVVSFKCSKIEQIEDYLIVESEESKEKIPIIVTIPKSQLILPKTRINLGAITINQQTSSSFEIINDGTIPLNFRAECSDPLVTIKCASGQVLPDHDFEIGFIFQPKTPEKNHSFTINVYDENDDNQQIYVESSVYGHSLSVIMNDQEIEELNFGHIYFGQKRIMQVAIRNRSPLKRTFAVRKFFDSNSPQLTKLRSDALFYSVPNVC